MTEEDIFIDLGSGVGKVSKFQISASTPLKIVWVIEMAETTSKFAEVRIFLFKQITLLLFRFDF